MCVWKQLIYNLRGFDALSLSLSNTVEIHINNSFFLQAYAHYMILEAVLNKL